MGQEGSKNAQIFIETNETMVTAGQFVTGIVYLNVINDCRYRTVNVQLYGEEYCYWQQKRGSGDQQRTVIFRNHNLIVSETKYVAIFDNNLVPRGQYVFPFRILLPSQLPGSYYDSKNLYIRYELKTSLASGNYNTGQLIQHSTVINVYEPLRQPPSPLIARVEANPKCCSCCIDYGIVIVTLGCDRREAKSGQQINGTLMIDNQLGNRPVTNGVISFVDKKWKVADSGEIRREVLIDHPLYVLTEDVMVGQKKIFNWTAKIPNGLKFSTAIGSIVARYQVLKFSSSMGFCSNSPEVETLFVFHTTTPQIQIPSKCPKPSGWKPIVSNEMLINDLQTYSYRPHDQMPFLNRQGKNDQTQYNKILYDMISSKELLKKMDQPMNVTVVPMSQEIVIQSHPQQ